MKVICVTGATGFVGQHVLASLRCSGAFEIRVLTRKRDRFSNTDGVVPIVGDLSDRDSVSRFLTGGASVIHLAYSPASSMADNLAQTRQLTAVAAEKRVRRFLHVSTAVVVGRCQNKVVDEDTACRPSNEYERTKLAMEQVVEEELSARVDFAILRPTAVFGPGGQNLVRLADSLSRGQSMRLAVRAMLMGSRRMNLLYVENLAAAIGHLLDLPTPLRGTRFLVCDDNAPANEFRAVTEMLATELGVRAPAVPLDLSAVLPIVLRLMGRALANPRTLFRSDRLRATGYAAPVTLAEGIRRFARWYQAIATDSEVRI